MPKHYYVYILTNASRTLYTGMTNNLERRMYEHKRKLAPGMIVSIEPGIYFKGQGGYRHSDTVLITETGNLKLTEAPENIEALTFKK